jgi:phenylacetate-CoA ligase
MNRATLSRLQSDGLATLLDAIIPGNVFYARKFAGLKLPCPLADLPFTTRDELLAAQAALPPHGGLITERFERYVRMHQTSGTSTGRPLRWFDTPESWSAMLDCWIEKFVIGGLTSRDRFFFPFSFGPFIGFWSAFEAGIRMGCLCLPGGGMNSATRLRFLLDNSATVVFCTPTYALRLVEVAQSEKIDLPGSTVRAVIVAGEAGGSVLETRARIEAGWGARVFDHNGMTETGPLGFECLEAPGSLHLLETAIIPEVIDPQTLQPVPPGTPGELVVTSFRRVASPLIRYRTGDVVCIDPAPCPCGRAMVRLTGGIRSRLDDMVIVRGNNLHPAAIQAILHRFPDVAEYLVEIDQTGAMAEILLRIEPAPGGDGPTLAAKVAKAVHEELLFRIAVRAEAPGTLPRAEMKARRWVRKTAPGLDSPPPA